MAARRLLIVMIILLVISTVVAVVAPQPASRNEDRSAATTAEPVRADTQEAGWRRQADVIEVKVDLDSHGDSSRRRIEVSPGDQLRLEVAGPSGQQVTIPDLGLLETASRTAPAQFDLLLREPGRYPIHSSLAREPVAVILVEPDES